LVFLSEIISGILEGVNPGEAAPSFENSFLPHIPFHSIPISQPVIFHRYKVKRSDLVNNHGMGLLRAHDDSLFLSIASVYTDFAFHPWLFGRVTPNYFDKIENRRKYINWLVEKVLPLIVHFPLSAIHFDH